MANKNFIAEPPCTCQKFLGSHGKFLEKVVKYHSNVIFVRIKPKRHYHENLINFREIFGELLANF